MARPKKITAEPEDMTGNIQITPINLQVVAIPIMGIAPYVQHKFSEKAKKKIEDTHKAGGTAKSKKTREPRNFEEEYEAATHKDEEGRFGIPCAAFRTACVDACRATGMMMTRLKIALFVEPDAFDVGDATPLVHIHGQRECYQASVRNESGVVDLRARPMWRKWHAIVRVRFDAGMITASDVVNLLDRAGQQIGVGEGRPFSKKSCGTGFGVFKVVNAEDLPIEG